MDPLLDFSNQTALITGAAQGFGKLLAEGLAARGASLVISDINEAGVQAVAEELKAKGVQVIAMGCNVAKEAECKAMVDAAIATLGQLDIAVNNAGISQDFLPFELIDEETMDRQWAVNVKGVQFGMKHQIIQMKKQRGGSILNVSSMAGLGGAPKVAAYAAAKHAVIGLTKTAAAEVASKNIRVNAICPFFTLTAMVTESSLARDKDLDGIKDILGKGAPMKRLGEPHEIVNAMLLILSPGNTYMTGQAIAIDGGVSAM